MRLSILLKSLSEMEICSSSRDPQITGITCDSRAVLPGYIFVAIPGALTDGHLYIDDAIGRGAVAVVLERPCECEDVVMVKVPIARKALAELSRCFYGYADRDLYMIGITATNGKTTTTSMVKHLLSMHQIPTSIIGSVSYSFGGQQTKSTLTTPESTDLHAMLAKQRQAGIRVASMEVSSIAEEQYRVYGIEYDIVAFLNITPDHLPDHGSFDAYYQAKAKLIRTVAPGVPVILNRDDPLVYALAEETQGQVITMGIDRDDVDVAAENLQLRAGIPVFDLVIRRPIPTRAGIWEAGRWPVALSVPGRHTVYNAMAAMIIAICYGLQPKEITSNIVSFEGVERRLQIIFQGAFTMIDDHISDEDNTRKMLEALAVMTEGRPVHIIYAVRGNRGLDVNREVAAQFAGFCDRINWQTFIVTSSVDVARARDVVHDEERDAVLTDLGSAGYDINYIPALTKAIEETLPLVGDGDFFVLAGSHNMDKGARIALNFLADTRGDLDRDMILKPLEKRIMG
ncbi:MAG TPA: Mur ligase family protein [Clostridia bacterium]|nr:Mur ligase family protein [Clostridia bacterium]